jgi:hypothetical protein
LSDYDVAIHSDSLFAQAGHLDELKPADIKHLGLTDVEKAAQAAVLDATGIAFPVKFKIRPGSAARAAPNLPLPRSGT